MIEHRMKAIRELLFLKGPIETTLQKIEIEMRQMAGEVDFSNLRRAVPGEELTHKLDVPADSCAALYLVSDGVGVVTQPHRHETWAVIVGLEGQEMNQIYESVSSNTKDVQQIDVKIIGPGDSIIMSDEDIHGTVSVGATATFHLRLYGTDLSLLAPFSDRIYNAVPVGSQS